MPLLANSSALGVGAALGVGVAIAVRHILKPKKPTGQLWGSPLTTCSRRAIAACAEAGIDYEFVPIHLAIGEHKKPEYMKFQPYGKVPAWRDASGFDLFESRAIMRHVAEGSALLPADAPTRALIDQWISHEYSYFSPAFMPLYYMRVLKKAPLDEKLCASKEAELEGVLDIMEARATRHRRQWLRCIPLCLIGLPWISWLIAPPSPIDGGTRDLIAPLSPVSSCALCKAGRSRWTLEASSLFRQP